MEANRSFALHTTTKLWCHRRPTRCAHAGPTRRIAAAGWSTRTNWLLRSALYRSFAFPRVAHAAHAGPGHMRDAASSVRRLVQHRKRGVGEAATVVDGEVRFGAGRQPIADQPTPGIEQPGD